MLPMFFRELSSVLTPKFSMVFRGLLREELFSSHLCCAVVVPILMGAMPFLLSAFIPISIRPVLSKIYERLVSFRVSSSM